VLAAFATLLLGGVALAASPLTATGVATGSLAAGHTVQLQLSISHEGGWQQVSEVEVDLALRGRALEQLVIDPTHYSVVLQGEAGPAAFGDHAAFTGQYFRLDPASIGISAKGPKLGLSIPLSVTVQPPPGARLTLTARGFDLTTTGPTSLTPPVRTPRSFSWGLLAAAVLGALFAGSFLGSVVASRRRPPPRLSVYSTVQRRIEEERSRP
jgi:hypothetical protein